MPNIFLNAELCKMTDLQKEEEKKKKGKTRISDEHWIRYVDGKNDLKMRIINGLLI